MNNITIVKDVRQANKYELRGLLASIGSLFVAHDDPKKIAEIMKTAPLMVRAVYEESDGDIWALGNLASEIICS